MEFIKARIDVTKSNASKLKKILVECSGSRRRQTDIVPASEALAYAQAAGIKLELDLTYHATAEKSEEGPKGLDVSWSPSFGLSSDDVL